jgi:Leucine-rich repeat
MIYHLEGDRPLPQDPNNSDDLQMNPKTNNDSLVTEALLLRLTDCDTLDEIRVISLRNKELTSCLRMLSQCQNLNIAYLQGNRIHLQDMMYFQSFVNLKKIDLSNNQIASMPSAGIFQRLVNLRFLYLHNNKISKWHDIASLSALPGILHITLFSNPVYLVPGYRHFLVNSVPSLLALDHYVITDEERIDDASFGYRFRALNEFMKLHVPDYAREKSAE